MTPSAGLPWRVRLIGSLGVTTLGIDWLPGVCRHSWNDENRTDPARAESTARQCAEGAERVEGDGAGWSRLARNAAAQHVTCVELPEDREDKRLGENGQLDANPTLKEQAVERRKQHLPQFARAVPKRTMKLARGATADQTCDA